MTTTTEYAALSLYVYGSSVINKIDLPSGWELAEPLHPDNPGGFSYGVFRRTGSTEIVLAFTGSNEKLVADFAGTNAPAAIGLPSIQIPNAALVYERVLQAYGTNVAGSNITFTGHSLGGGLASVMAVWYNRPAVVFDEAPFELTAISPVQLGLVRAFLLAKGYFNNAMDNAISDFPSRQQQVDHHFLEGEFLASLRTNATAVAGSNTRVDINGSDAGAIQLHSQALLTASLLSNDFRLSTYASKRVIPILLDEKFYFFDTSSSSQQNILIKFIRSEQGTGDILTHFAADLNKLGTNLAGLNKAAQDAIIAQGVEWYYWQGTDYAGQNFFIDNGQAGLLQYTSAVGAALPGALNKATTYTQKWLSEVYVAHGGTAGTTFPPFGTLFNQWSVATGSNAVTVTARDNNKNQIYIGGAGTDTFTASNAGDVILAGGGADSITGGTGGDRLYGGQGNDEYIFNASFGADLIQDSDGAGEIKVDGTTLDGGKKVDDNVWESADGVYRYQLFSHGATSDLVIGRGSKASCRNPRSMNIKMHSSLCTLHESRGRIRFRIRLASLLKQPQYTFNGYSESQFLHPFKTKAATCAH